MSTKKLSPARKFLRKIIGKEPSFGQMLQAFRECDGFSQVSLARKIGISRQNLCDIEKGRRSVSVETAAKIATVMGYSVERFVARAIQDNLERSNLKLKVYLEAA